MENLLVYTPEATAEKVRHLLPKVLNTRKGEQFMEDQRSYPGELIFPQNPNLQDLKAKVEKVRDLLQRFTEEINNKPEIKDSTLDTPKMLLLAGKTLPDVLDVINQKLTDLNARYIPLHQELSALMEEQKNIEDFAIFLEVLEKIQNPFTFQQQFNYFTILLSSFDKDAKKKLESALNREDAYSAYALKELSPDHTIAIVLTLKKYRALMETLLHKINAKLVEVPRRLKSLTYITEESIQKVKNEINTRIQELNQEMEQILTEIAPHISAINNIVQNASIVIQNQEVFERFANYRIYKLKIKTEHFSTFLDKMQAKFRNKVRIQLESTKKSYKELVPRLNLIETMTRELCEIVAREENPNYTLECPNTE